MRHGLPRKGTGFPDRFVLVIITVVTAAGSFTLGYFVGRNTPFSALTQPAVPKEQKLSVNQPAVENSISSKEEKPTEFATAASQAPAPSKKQEIPSTKPIVQEEKKAVSPEPKAGADSKDAATQNIEREKTSGSAPKDENVSTGKSNTYTVQTGAFRKQKEADRLRLKLEGKGYKAYTKKAASKGAVIYKVMVGDFNSKKDAEVFALKLKKTEGINAFAAVSN